MLLLIAVLVVVYFLIRKFKNVHYFWIDRGVPSMDLSYIFKNYTNFFKKTLGKTSTDVYYRHPDARYVGMVTLFTPSIMIRDPELIKKVTVKDFDAFANHWDFVNADIDPLWSSNLFNMNDEAWRKMRATLSPSFTSNKMKHMFNFMLDCSEQVTNYLQNQKSDVIELEMKNFYRRYANDVIATTAFGIKVDSLKDQENEFFLMGKAVSTVLPLKIFLLFTVGKIPIIKNLFNIKMIDTKVGDYFTSIIYDTLGVRRKNNIVRQDMIHLLLEAQKGTSKDGENKVQEISDFDIAANGLIFFLAGFDTTSTVMSFVSYELALNPDIQERLFKEIEAVLEKNDGKLTYDAVVGMKYLDMVLSETLRKWPVLYLNDRKSTKDYTIEPENANETAVVIPKGTFTWIPTYALHHDPKYFPNPSKFDPERFSDENKHKINPYTYVPFGVGPRLCIGSRFAQLEVKILLVKILKDFEFVPTKKTEIPIQLLNANNLLQPKNGIYLDLKRRN